MPSNTGAWILLGVLAGIASLASAANIQRNEDQTIHQSNGNTFLSNGAGQIIRGPDGRTVLIGSDGRRIITDADYSDYDMPRDYDYSGNFNNVIINGGSGSSVFQNNGHSSAFGDWSQGSYVSSNGRTIRVINGAMELNDHGQVYTFKPKAAGVNEKETVTINGQPAQVEYTNGDIVVELADHTVIAKIGERTFVGDRESFDNRDKLEAEAKNYAARIHQQVQDNIRKTMEDIQRNLQGSMGHIFY
ncbi:uncharacterized protein LOC6547529 [Drosophila erecta]|uniref:CG18067 protein n=1 Tax=Drosophila erecta TaxID=7220 RepID=B3NJK6_DROER|nr:uncharacterized protein LOC6547529 [Drosophila erecta]EDV55313.1 uncharacterized protein Dere_GG22040 [Drosophila erecta]